MTDPKNTEQQSEELSLEKLEDAAGGAFIECKVPPAIWTDGAGASLKKSNLDTGSGNDRLTQPKTGWSSTDAEFNG